MSEVAQRVRDDILHAIQTDNMVLPTLPEIALQVREVAEDPDANINTLTQVIGKDTALSARVVKVANSPLLRGNRAKIGRASCRERGRRTGRGGCEHRNR